ncbi:MAG: hypothetical protein P4M12_02275 [Gammaproteobacteria bacterium]|nr:hypothetical protein [Gammaproteobacteria bacterium]
MIAEEIVKKINEIGEKYLSHHKKNYFSLRYLFTSHTNHPIALRLKNFTSLSTNPSDYEKFLLSCYYRLPKFEGEIARAIESLMLSELNKSITSELLIKSFTLENLHALGADYLGLPKSTWSQLVSFYDDTEIIATRLINCDLKKYNQLTPPIPSYQKTWLTLVHIYSQTATESKNKLKQDILTLISNTFGFFIHTVEACDGVTIPVSSCKIADDITSSMQSIFEGLKKTDHELVEMGSAPASSSSRP